MGFRRFFLEHAPCWSILLRIIGVLSWKQIRTSPIPRTPGTATTGRLGRWCWTSIS